MSNGRLELRRATLAVCVFVLMGAITGVCPGQAPSEKTPATNTACPQSRVLTCQGRRQHLIAGGGIPIDREGRSGRIAEDSVCLGHPQFGGACKVRSRFRRRAGSSCPVTQVGDSERVVFCGRAPGSIQGLGGAELSGPRGSRACTAAGRHARTGDLGPATRGDRTPAARRRNDRGSDE